MEGGNSHPLLQQIPLTVSPFISFPKATTLPYTWKALPSTLPPSTAGEDSRAQYIISPSGHAAHPNEIIASASALRAHLDKLQADAEETLRQWREGIEERELAEKRKVAPGWLDREEKILQPTKKGEVTAAGQRQSLMDVVDEGVPVMKSLTQQRDEEREEMDRALEGLSLK